MSEQQKGEHKKQADKAQEHSDEPVYVISIAAKLANLPLWTLRVLDKEGIVVPRRTVQGRRLYSDRDTARLARVRYLTEERGVNMAGVRVILEMDLELETDSETEGGAHRRPEEGNST